MKILRLIQVLLGLLFLALPSYAGLFTIDNRTGTCASTPVCDYLENEVNSNLPDANPGDYLDGIANSSVMSQKGLAVDYSSSMDFMVFGASLGAGADLGDTSTTDLLSGDVEADQIGGFAAGATLMLGVNGGMFSKDLERFNFYLNYLSFDWSKDDINGDAQSIGFHVQGKVIKGGSIGFGAVGWSGLDIISGVEFASSKINLAQDINESVSYSGFTGSFVGRASISTDVKTTSIPIEVASSLNLFNVSLYGGLGTDISFGSAEGNVSLTGDVNVTGGTGEGNLSIGSKKSPDSFLFRGFAGAQINITAIQLYTHLNKSLSNDTVGVGFGLRVGF